MLEFGGLGSASPQPDLINGLPCVFQVLWDVCWMVQAGDWSMRQRFGPSFFGRVAVLTGLAIGFVSALLGAARQQSASNPASSPAARPDPARWEKSIATFEDWDRKNSPPANAVLFVGSSSIVGWSTAEAFSQHAVINRGFGGSHISEVTHYFDRVVAPYRPAVVVLYAGDNDIAAGLSAEQVAADFAAFVARFRGKFRETPIVFLSIKPSPARWEHWPTARAANRLIATLCEKQPGLRFVDVAAPMLDENGQPRAELYVADRLHLSAPGYAAWEAVLRPVLAELCRRKPPGE